MPINSDTPEIKDEELELLLVDIHNKYGYDFTDYTRASLKRRINRLMVLDRFPSFAELRFHIISNVMYLRRFIEEITVNVTEMFRDPDFFRHLRETIFPILGTYPFIRIWVAGCATGEEAYSLAILLKETNLFDKSIIYATDLNPGVLEEAKQGIYSLKQMKLFSENYGLSGGTGAFSAYYCAQYGTAIFKEYLREKIVFSNHNLASDRSFNQFQLILCRNVLIYFQPQLQERVFQVFDDSLEDLGYLALGSKETMRFSQVAQRYQQTHTPYKIWRKYGA